MVDVRSAADHRQKERPAFDPKTEDMFCLPSISGAHGCGPWLVHGD